MQQFFITLMLLVGLGSGIHTVEAAETDQTIDTTNIIFKPSSKGDTKDYPRMPAYSPIYGVVSGDVLTIYSRVEGEADVTVADAAGTIIMNLPVADLTCGYPVVLPAEKTGLKVSVTFNGVTYSATI